MSFSRIPYRWLIPLAAFITLFVGQIKGCAACARFPLLTFAGEFYFGALALLALIFSFEKVKAFGFAFALVLSVSLMSYASEFCLTCWIAHSLHLLFWASYGLSLSAYLATAALAFCMPFLPYDALSMGPAPAFSFVTEQGQEVRPKSVVLHFVKRDCPYCAEQTEELCALVTKYPELFVVNISQQPSDDPCELPFYIDRDGHLMQAFGVNLFPTTVVIGKKGQIKAVLRGQFDNLENLIPLNSLL